MNKSINNKNIKKKCILCGNCAAVCPKQAISYDNKKEKVIVDKNLCVNCGLCVKNCPTESLSDSGSLLGNVKGVYAGYANDNSIRYKSASGGLLTQTLKYLLENKIVDRVLITDFKNDKFQSEGYFTDNIEEVLNACGSKYQIVNVNKALNTVIKEDLKYAYVGLPCHHIGLEKFIKSNPKVKDRIIYKFAICCSHNCNISIIDYIAHYLKIDKNNIDSIKYRGDGWPEYFTINLKNGAKKKFPKNLWNLLFLSFFYTPKQCFSCNDFCGENSDISFADAWLEEYTSKESDGYNLIFSHNDKGENLMAQMSEAKIINLNQHTYNDVIKSQKIGLFYKKYLKKSLKLNNIFLKFIIKINTYLSKQHIFKFVNPLFLKYYFYILNFLFIKKELKCFEETLLNENSNH